MFGYITLLLRMMLKDCMGGAKTAVLFAVMMFLNNIVYFAMWAIYFYNFSSLNGWTLKDFAILQGICTMAFGLGFFFCGGSWNIGRAIFSGGLDSYLGKPRHPLLPLLMSECRSSTIGDILSSFVFWLWFGQCSLADLPLLMLLSVAAAMMFITFMILVQSIAFWASEVTTIAENLFEVFITLALYPQNIYGPFVRMLLFTVMPVAYVGLLPVEIMRDFSGMKLAAVLAAAVLYLGFAIFVFQQGLRRYTSGNLMQR